MNKTVQRKLGSLYEHTIAYFIPQYSFLSLVFCFVYNSLIYFGLQRLMESVRHYDLTSDYDRAIPFVPEWSIIYLGCYLFWVINYILIARQPEEDWFKFATADYMSRTVCALFFFFLPTTNIRPEVMGNGLPAVLMRFVYSMDAPTNLFPSIHCLVSWFCFIGIRGKRSIPKWYQMFSMFFAVAVFMSTLFTKQHYIIDVIGGVLLAEVCYYIGNHTMFYQKIRNLFTVINRKVFGETL